MARHTNPVTLRRSWWHWSPQYNLNWRLETSTGAPQAATTELLVAGVAQWVRFVWNRRQKGYVSGRFNYILETAGFSSTIEVPWVRMCSHGQSPWNLNWRLETINEAPQAATTEILVAGIAHWVRFLWKRWLGRYVVCASQIAYEARENFFKVVAVISLVQDQTILSLLKVGENWVE